ncbi:MAG: ATP-grasp domain-containing protein [Chloroflexota bacterium]|jgi:biotin carboxylase
MNGNSNQVDRASLPKRVLLLLTARTYRAYAFISAAKKLDIEVIQAIDMDPQLAEYWNYPLGLQYDDPNSCVEAITSFADSKPLGAILAVDDSGVRVAAKASQALGLPHNPPMAAEASGNKYRMRQLLSQSDVLSPEATLHHFSQPNFENKLLALAETLNYPCILKPTSLNGSRGVIRANQPEEFVTAATRLNLFLANLYPDSEQIPYLVESYIPGEEVAVEGIMVNDQLQILAIFDKPDPLEGPYFEETLYITPSRLSPEIQKTVYEATAKAASAIGLKEGPVHAELRINDAGPWIIEIAGRSIGGLCGATLKFGIETSLEELILRQAFGLDISSFQRENKASGVMMIPIPEAGLLKGVQGCEEAEALPLVEKVEITAKLNNMLTPLPEGDSYLGFIFAKGSSPEKVENALREAHRKLRFTIAPKIPLLNIL